MRISDWSSDVCSSDLEALDDLVESPGNRRQRGERLDQAVTTRNGVPALHGLAVAKHGSRRQVAFAVREGLVELHREGMSAVVQTVFAGRDVDPQVGPFLRQDLRHTAIRT